MVTNTVLRERKQRIEGDIVIFEARLKGATESLEKTGLQSRLDELRMRVASIDSVLNAIIKLNSTKKAEEEGYISTALSVIPVEKAPQRKKRAKRGRQVKAEPSRKRGEAKPLFQP